MKVALVCPYDWTRPGGVQAHVAALASRLAARHDVAVFAPHRDGQASAVVSAAVGSAAVVDVGRPVPVTYNRSIAAVALAPAAAVRTVRGLRRFAPDVTHIHEPLSPLVSVAAAIRGRGPLVATFHAWSDSDRVYRMIAPVGHRIVNRLDVRIAVSPAAQAYAGQALGLPFQQFRVIPNGVDVDRFASAEPLPELTDPTRPLLLFVGRLEPRKGLDVLIRAFLRVRAALPRVRLCVVGDGRQRQRCQDMIPESIRHDVRFVGRVSEEDKPRYFASAQLYVAPNTGAESFGIVLAEAMAAGVPVVASDIPGFRPVVRDGRAGRLVPPGDAPALAEAISTLLGTAALRRALATEGRRRVAELDWATVSTQIEEVYDVAVDVHARPSDGRRR